MRGFSVFLLTLFLTFGAASQESQNIQEIPSQAPREKQETQSNQRGTDNEPFFIKLPPAQQDKHEATQEANERSEKHTFERQTAEATGDLAYFTEILAIASVVLGFVTFCLVIATGAPGKPGWLFVYGCIEYLDGFKKPRWINFCFRYSMAAAKGGFSIPAEDARYHEKGNKTDEG